MEGVLTNVIRGPGRAKHHGGVEHEDDDESKQEPNHGLAAVSQHFRHALHRLRRRRERAGSHPFVALTGRRSLLLPSLDLFSPSGPTTF